MTELTVRFKEGVNPNEWDYLHPRVKVVFETLAILMMRCGLDVEITSMLRKPGTIAGESGVHATGRALDCVPRIKSKDSSKTRLDYRFMQKTADFLNLVFTRSDQKNTVIWHDVGAHGWHFHLQVQAERSWRDLTGVIPEKNSAPAEEAI